MKSAVNERSGPGSTLSYTESRPPPFSFLAGFATLLRAISSHVHVHPGPQPVANLSPAHITLILATCCVITSSAARLRSHQRAYEPCSYLLHVPARCPAFLRDTQLWKVPSSPGDQHVAIPESCQLAGTGSFSVFGDNVEDFFARTSLSLSPCGVGPFCCMLLFHQSALQRAALARSGPYRCDGSYFVALSRAQVLRWFYLPCPCPP